MPLADELTPMHFNRRIGINGRGLQVPDRDRPAMNPRRHISTAVFARLVVNYPKPKSMEKDQ
jgi:hypothetical protein